MCSACYEYLECELFCGILTVDCYCHYLCQVKLDGKVCLIHSISNTEMLMVVAQIVTSKACKCSELFIYFFIVKVSEKVLSKIL